MKSFVLEPTPKNILETFMTDLLGRRQDVAYFVSLLNLLERGTSIALDARWGAGKTFFVKQAKLVLDVFNEHTSICNEEEGKQVKAAWSKLKGSNQSFSLKSLCIMTLGLTTMTKIPYCH